MKPTKQVPIFRGGAVRLVDEETALRMAAEAFEGVPSNEPLEPLTESSGGVTEPFNLHME